MKRSNVNEVLQAADAFIHSFGHILPPFAYWTPDEMRSDRARTIRERGLGWDITDYGEGRFNELGLFLFTSRNGSLRDLGQGMGMLYAEKIMITRQNQISPMHRHNLKTEDIINRGGGDLVIQLYASDHTGGIDRNGAFTVPSDGEILSLESGGHLRLRPGQSITLHPGIWHAFWAEGGDCLVGEVSTVNDDRTDNVFEMPIKRFAKIIEDEAPQHLMVSDY